MNNMAGNPHKGSSVDDFLKKEGMYEETSSVALKRVLAWQLQQEMQRQHLTKAALAIRMNTSRSQLDRLLDPNKTGVSLETIQRAARETGRQLRIELV
jgi:antitoxin HicB